MENKELIEQFVSKDAMNDLDNCIIQLKNAVYLAEKLNSLLNQLKTG